MSAATIIPTRTGLYIAGEERLQSDDEFASFDPSTGEPLSTVAVASAVDVDAAVNAARHAFEGGWGALSVAEQGRILHRISERIATARDVLGEIAARDAGIPISIAKADVGTAARYFEFYAGSADKRLGTDYPDLLGCDRLHRAGTLGSVRDHRALQLPGADVRT